MKKATLCSIFLAYTILSFAQFPVGKLEIGSSKIRFEYEESYFVYRTVTDTIISCDATKYNRRIGSTTRGLTVHPSDIKSYHREIFKDKGCIWTRITNDVISRNNSSLNFSNDSASYFKLPLSCERVDTVMQIDPITLAEEQVEQHEEYYTFQTDCGNISKTELYQAVVNKFNISKNNFDLNLWGLSLYIIKNDSCQSIDINYNKPLELETAKLQIADLPIDTRLCIDRLYFTDNKGVNLGLSYDRIAVMQIK